MTDDTSKIDLTRRKALAAMGTIGVASAGAGFGTSAFFSDRETFENNQLTAGTLDMKLAWETHYSDWSEDEAQFAHMPNGDGGQAPTFRLPADGEDAQPIELAVTDGPGFLGATQQSVEHGGVFADNPLCGTDADAPDEQVLIDLGDVIVHVFQPEVRETYDFERLWSDAPALELPALAEAQAAGESRAG